MKKKFTITSIRSQKKRKRFNIYLDGKFGFAVSAEALGKADLSVDQEITEEDIKILRYKDTKSKLYDRVLKFLSYRPRSEREVRDYLNRSIGTRKREGSKSAKIVEAIIKKLKDQELIDDRDFAAWWIEQRSRFRPKGRRALWLELLQKGVEKEVIEDALISEKEEVDLAKKAVRKKLKTGDRQKITAFLARRGFSWEIIKKVLK